MTRWRLPDFVRDELPPVAEQLEQLRARVLALLQGYGYRLIYTPLVEFVESLTVGRGRDLGERLVVSTDPYSGRMVAVRADVTPQAARVDAHLLGVEGVVRLCYAAPVLYARPRDLLGVRDPLLAGGELFGCSSAEADGEVAELMVAALGVAGFREVRVEFSQMALFRALTRGIGEEEAELLFTALGRKEVGAVREWLEGPGAKLPRDAQTVIAWLPRAYGEGERVIEEARRRCRGMAEAEQALEELTTVVRGFERRVREGEIRVTVGVDLADLRGYHYHTGVMFAAFVPTSPSAVALGGRYDGMGEAFGRSRPATGFSMDLRAVTALRPLPPEREAVWAPWVEEEEEQRALRAAVAQLRQVGEVVVQELPGCRCTAGMGLKYSRRLVRKTEGWVVVEEKGRMTHGEGGA
ncbi:MAG: ATP phosphoribosyltransferase regulatory subunit [Hydrogenophilus sp.]|nr:ATP phosphoribosyltransferase regulatory subunit [Hydrogenophilus sp.]